MADDNSDGVHSENITGDAGRARAAEETRTRATRAAAATRTAAAGRGNAEGRAAPARQPLEPQEDEEEPQSEESAPKLSFGTVRPKLSGPGNFSIWKFKMELLLDEAGVLILVEIPVTEEQKHSVEYLKGNRRAMMLLANNIEDSQMSYIRQTRYASDAWAQLTTVYPTAFLSHKLYLREQLRTVKQKEGETITSYVGRLKEIAVQLDAADATQPEQELLLILLGGALPKFKDCTTTLENYPGELTLEKVINALQAAELRLDLKDGTPDDTSGLPGNNKVLYAGSKKPGQQGKGGWKAQGKEMRACFYCQKPGHLKKDCRKMKADLEAKGRDWGGPPGDEHAHQADMAWQAKGLRCVNSGEWCIDSGASRHMCHDKAMFKTLHKSTGQKIYVADGRSMEVEASGVVVLTLAHQGKVTTVDLHDVLYVPKLH